MHHHKKIRRWLQPGGHLEANESPLEAGVRETLEETGVTVDVDPKIFHVDVHSTPSGHVHYDIRFKAKARDLFLRPYDGESKQIAWWKPGALSNIDDPSMTGAIAKLFA